MYFQAKDYSPVPTGTKVAFIGLGTMGFPMAGHLLHAGCQVTVYNRTASKAQAWVENSAAKLLPRLVKPQKMRMLSLPVSAMTATCAACCSEKTALLPA